MIQYPKMHYAFLDIKSAYDTVARDLLEAKGRDMGMDERLITMPVALFDYNIPIL